MPAAEVAAAGLPDLGCTTVLPGRRRNVMCNAEFEDKAGIVDCWVERVDGVGGVASSTTAPATRTSCESTRFMNGTRTY
jgi:hypothetical protein